MLKPGLQQDISSIKRDMGFTNSYFRKPTRATSDNDDDCTNNDLSDVDDSDDQERRRLEGSPRN